jgi:hypothetical protein
MQERLIEQQQSVGVPTISANNDEATWSLDCFPLGIQYRLP